MRTSDKLPTAVDYTNILVNYIEVSYDDLPRPPQPAPNQTEQQKLDAATPVEELDKPTGVYPPQVISNPSDVAPMKAPLPEPATPKVPEPSKRYHQNIPRYLLDLDSSEETSRFKRANETTNNLPTPPTLPGFLGKSILNGTTPHKDDSSVLIMPNHTVLNHLATSSIKDNILATSATTRYKQKVCILSLLFRTIVDTLPVPHNHHVQTEGRRPRSVLKLWHNTLAWFFSYCIHEIRFYEDFCMHYVIPQRNPSDRSGKAEYIQHCIERDIFQFGGSYTGWREQHEYFRARSHFVVGYAGSQSMNIRLCSLHTAKPQPRCLAEKTRLGPRQKVRRGVVIAGIGSRHGPT